MHPRDIKVGRPSKQKAIVLGTHVVAMADKLFFENGFADTSMAMVASNARIGKQTLYSRYPDKAALFREVVRLRVEGINAKLTRNSATRGPSSDLRHAGRLALDLALDPEFIRLYQIVIAEASIFPDLASAMAYSVCTVLEYRCSNAIREAQALGWCNPASPEILSSFYLWSLIGDVLFKNLSGQSVLLCSDDREDYIEAALSNIFHGILDHE